MIDEQRLERLRQASKEAYRIARELEYRGIVPLNLQPLYYKRRAVDTPVKR